MRSRSDLKRLRTLKGPEWVISVGFRPDNRGLFVAGGAEAIGGKRFVQEWEVPLFSK
ncbi:MAG: hypothetical protein ACC628_21420 [Pirellulaceae bacterium]